MSRTSQEYTTRATTYCRRPPQSRKSHGYSQNYYAVYGTAQGTSGAIGGFNVDSLNGGPGVYGESIVGAGVMGYSVGGYALMAQGSIYATGEIYTGGTCHSGCSRTRQQAAFVSRTSQPTIDDVGEATLHSGVTHVGLAPDFANTIDTRKPCVVLLTPEGDTGLFVTNRTATGFEVLEIGGGHGSIPFAYRIVAKPLGSSNERLPFKIVTDNPAGSQPRL